MMCDRGVILRTTHLTGLVTDCGSALGMRLRGYSGLRRSYLVPVMLAFVFLAGGVCSGLMCVFYKMDMLTFMGCGYVLAGLGRSVAKRIKFFQGTWLRVDVCDLKI
jgi:uncharacterized membrane protein YoaK (UPF0700 family)